MKEELDHHKKFLHRLFQHCQHIYRTAYSLQKIKTLINELTSYQVFLTFYLKNAYYQVPLCEDDNPFTAFEENGCLY